MTLARKSHGPPLTRPATALLSLPGGSLLVSALVQFSMSADKLRLQLDSLYVIGATTVLGSPERQAVLEQLEPLLASIHALNDELEVDPITTEDP